MSTSINIHASRYLKDIKVSVFKIKDTGRVCTDLRITALHGFSNNVAVFLDNAQQVQMLRAAIVNAIDEFLKKGE